ncbi:putative acetyltransferase [Arthrobacter sp. PvP102]|uniref:GNAT family N-acetyltransferase n=1 Tax=unclassified Arthrobacter TaxID=235627 RepID=UPI001AE56C3B|nr:MULTISPECIES: GNAT family N-acetyltransferase [unclassified Arthrobacter]MBP1234497.1 putative acetyltransferase [Arthrobacter sp. PvP103]MBP1239631.1 putative acetyltransferase [Arthrobacter sp. PvP102]
MFELVVPDASFYPSFAESHREWDGAHQDGAGLLPDDDVTSPEGFADWVRRLSRAERAAGAGGIVPCTYRWITEGSRYVGAIAFRHYLTPALLNSGGHIGYGVRPSDRGRGAASWALQEVCARLAAQEEPDRVLLTCDDANAASARTIERCGGLLEDVRVGGNGRPFRRYWIDVARS